MHHIVDHVFYHIVLHSVWHVAQGVATFVTMFFYHIVDCRLHPVLYCIVDRTLDHISTNLFCTMLCATLEMLRERCTLFRGNRQEQEFKASDIDTLCAYICLALI